MRALGQHGAHLMPLPARGDRSGESLCQSVSLRAVADERQERSPLFFDRNQLLEDVVAVERLYADAESLARGNGLGADSAAFERLFVFAHPPGDGRFNGTNSLGKAFARCRFGHVQGGPRIAQPRQVGAGYLDVGDLGELLHGVGEHAFTALALEGGSVAGGFGGLDVLNHGFGAAADGFLVGAHFDGAKLSDIELGGEPFEGRERDLLVLGMERDLHQVGRFGQPRERVGSGGLLCGMPGDAAERLRVDNPVERRAGHRLGGAALGDRREPSRIGNGLNGCERHGHLVGALGVHGAVGSWGCRLAGEGHEPIRGALARFAVGVGGRNPAEGSGIIDLGQCRSPNPDVRVGLREDGELGRVIQFPDGVDSNDGVDVLPAGLRLQAIEDSHRR